MIIEMSLLKAFIFLPQLKCLQIKVASRQQHMTLVVCLAIVTLTTAPVKISITVLWHFFHAIDPRKGIWIRLFVSPE